MSLLWLLIWLVIIGVVMFLVSRPEAPIDPFVKNLLRWVCIIAAVGVIIVFLIGLTHGIDTNGSGLNVR